jgi:hypothetical protein
MIIYNIIVIIIVTIFLFLIFSKSIVEEYLDVKIDRNIINKGSEHFRKSNVIVCGLARDIEDKIENLDKNLNSITSCFDKHLILIVENNSEDNTRKKLFELKKKYNLLILGCGVDSKQKCQYNTKKMKGSSVQRMSKMVFLRNIYMNYINNLSNSTYYEYCIMIDCDLKTIFNRKRIQSSGYYFNKYNYIDMIGSNNIRKYIPNNIYYDIYSLGASKKYILFLNRFRYDLKCQKNIKDLIKVDSCFGGFVIYKLSSILGKKYTLEKTWYGAECEHVTFHKTLKYIYINPKMLIPIFAHD